MLMFTNEELSKFKIKQLKRLADYYSVKYNSHTTKSELVDSIMLTLGVLYKEEQESEEPKMSVRVRRIKESMEA